MLGIGPEVKDFHQLTRRAAIRRSIIILTVALVAGTTQVRANQIVTYNMTGVITWDGSMTNDRISWTVQYDPSTPVTSPLAHGNYYSLNGPVITNIVDQNTGYHFLPTPLPSNASGSIDLHLSGYDGESALSGPSAIGITSYYKGGNPLSSYSSELDLFPLNSLPTTNLASLQLNTIPFALGTTSVNGRSSEFDFGQENYYTGAVNAQFVANVTSISGPVAPAPEPGSLTLFLLGLIGLAAHCVRRRLRQVGLSLLLMQGF